MLTLLLASVYLNGVNIDGLRSQKFEKCKAVRIDDRGDVHLECPGYQVENQAAAAPALAPGTPAPLLPAIKPCQVDSAVLPSGVTKPRPVTTTRRLIKI